MTELSATAARRVRLPQGGDAGRAGLELRKGERQRELRAASCLPLPLPLAGGGSSPLCRLNTAAAAAAAAPVAAPTAAPAAAAAALQFLVGRDGIPIDRWLS